MAFWVVKGYGQLTLTASSTTYANTAITLTLTSTGTPPFPISNIVWFHNGIPMAGTGAFYSAIRPGVYYASAMVGLTYVKSNMIEINPDCSDNNAPKYLDGFKFTSGTYSIDNTNIVTGGYYMARIEGELTIESGAIVHFKDLHFDMSQCAKIIIKPNGVLKFDNCVLSSCYNWKHIEIQDDAEIIMDKSYLMDAYYGLIFRKLTSQPRRILLTNSYFGNNYGSIKLSDLPTSPGGFIAHISGNKFGRFLTSNEIQCSIDNNDYSSFYNNDHAQVSLQGGMGGLVYDNSFYNLEYNSIGYRNLQIYKNFRPWINKNTFYNGGDMCIESLYNNKFLDSANYFANLNYSSLGIPNFQICRNNASPTHANFGVYDYMANGANHPSWTSITPLHWRNTFVGFNNKGCGLYVCYYPAPTSHHYVNENTFNECEHGIVFSNNQYPISSTSSNSNTAQIFIKTRCNIFNSTNSNYYGIVGVGELIQQGENSSPSFYSAGNKFRINRQKALLTNNGGSINDYFKDPSILTEIPQIGGSIIMDGISVTSLGMLTPNNASPCPNSGPQPLIMKSNPKNTIDLFPNPVSNMLIVKSNLNYNSFVITNLIGEIILKKEFTGCLINKIDLSSFTSGSYTISIKFIDGTIKNSLFIKQ